MSFDPNIERKDQSVCRECGAKLDLEQQLGQANGEKGYCHECTCSDCGHEMSEHSDADCDTCQTCNIDKGDRLHDQAKEQEPDAPDAMDLPEDYSGKEELGRVDARTGLM